MKIYVLPALALAPSKVASSFVPAAGDAGVIAIAVVGVLALAAAVMVIRKKK